MKSVKFPQFAPIGSGQVQDDSKLDEIKASSHSFALQNPDITMDHDDLFQIMEERMKREECILSTSPHKKVVNAIRYAKAINSSLNSSLEKTLGLLHREFEKEFRRIVEVQQTACREFPELERYFRSSFSGVTNKQFRRRLGEALASKRRGEEFKRTRTRLSLPSLSPVEPISHEDNVYVPLSRSKKDSEIVYLPPIWWCILFNEICSVWRHFVSRLCHSFTTSSACIIKSSSVSSSCNTVCYVRLH